MNILMILGISGGVLLVLAVVYQIIHLQKYRGMHFNWFSFKREGMEMGLEKPEIRLLRDIAYQNRLTYFNSIYTTAKILDSCVIKSVHLIKEQDISEEEKHNRIEAVFLLRNKMDQIFAARMRTLTSTRSLKKGQPLTLTFKRIGTYNSSVLENTSQYLAVAMPPEALKVQEFTWIGKRTRIIFRISNDAEYATITKVLDQSLGEGGAFLRLEHSEDLTRTQKRIFRRNNVNISVDMFLLKMKTIGHHRKLAVGNPTPFKGLITNLSAAGVAIRAGGILKENTLLKLEFSLDFEHNNVAIGRVLAYSAIPESADKMLHIKFERMSKKTRNSIFEYIYQENIYQPKATKQRPITPTKEGLIIKSVDQNTPTPTRTTQRRGDTNGS